MSKPNLQPASLSCTLNHTLDARIEHAHIIARVALSPDIRMYRYQPMYPHRTFRLHSQHTHTYIRPFPVVRMIAALLHSRFQRFYPLIIVPAGGIALAAGGRHSVVLLSDQSVWAAGDNGYGQLGTGLPITSITDFYSLGFMMVIPPGQCSIGLQ